MRFNDAVIGLGLIAAAIALALYSMGIPTLPGMPIGANALPAVIALGLAGSGVAMVVVGLRNRLPLLTLNTTLGPGAALRGLSVVLAIIFYGLASSTLGFILTTMIYLTTLMGVMRVNIVHNIAVSVILPIVVYIVFFKILSVPVPTGMIEQALGRFL